MENQKNNKGIVALLIVIIVILSVLCVLFATGAISFKESSTNNSQQIDETDQVNNNEETELTEDEAMTIVKNVFTNSTVQYLVDLVSVTYCNTEPTIISEEELGLDYQWNGYQKCTDFSSYDELTNYFKRYVTENFYYDTVLKKSYIKQKNTLSDGTVMYNYYEKDGNLYAAITGKGSNVNKYKFLDDETVYKIDKFDNNQITATITAKWEDASQNNYTELEKITIINDNDNWKINFYESTQI